MLYGGFHIILQGHAATKSPGVKQDKQLTGMNASLCFESASKQKPMSYLAVHTTYHY